MKSHRWLVILFVGFLLFVSACNAGMLNDRQSNLTQQPKPLEQTTESSSDERSAVPETIEPRPPEAQIDFHVQIPDDTPTTDAVYLTILDEVTGLYLNAQNYPMVLDPETGVHSVQLSFPLGSVVKYRYERQGDQLRVAEHTSDGNPVRYRLFLVNAPGGIDDVVSRWTDTEYTAASGRIMGTATDATTGNPIPNLLMSAGGAQTYTHSDGSFLIEGLPPGIHNLVGYALDGGYQTFQQGAEIAADATTPTPIQLAPAQFVEVNLIVTPPANTPPVIPLRLAGNLYQLGNTFGTLSGGVSTQATRMPILAPLADGRYQLTLQLPVGADIRYKYTLGDGYWNAEHAADGSFRLRQLIVPQEGVTIQDSVLTWETNPGASLTFDLIVPETTPADDFVSIQFNPLFGWTEPVPMWSLGGNRWAYVLYSPLNLPGNLSYRYCRNSQCGSADDAATPGMYGAGRVASLDQLPQVYKDTVESWYGLGQPLDQAAFDPGAVNARGSGFVAGVELSPTYYPSWQPFISKTFQRLTNLGANWVGIDPTWSVTRANPPVVEPVAGRDALWPDLISTIQQAKAQGHKVVVKPVMTFPSYTAVACNEAICPTAADLWWQEGQRDYSWWLVWFEHYRDFLLHHADLATQTGADALVIGGDWLNPAMPSGLLVDGAPSGILSDAEGRWRNLIADVRQRYQGPLLWSLGYTEGQILPPFLDTVDQIYLDWRINPGSPDNPSPAVDELEAQFSADLDGRIKDIQTLTGKPILVAISAPSNPDMVYQNNNYEALLSALSQREWISGVISSQYYPPAELQDSTSSVHGKSAEVLLQNWFFGLLTEQP